MIEIVRQNATEIQLNQDIYALAYDNDISLSQLLELIDPSDHEDKKDGLDAFERQLMRYGIRSKDDSRTGTGASRGEMFFQSNHPEARILFPEFLNRVARIAVLDETDIMSEIVSRTETLEGTNMYRAIYIDDTAAQRKTYRVGEGGKFPVTKITWSEKATSLAKFGVALEMSYEFVRRASLPLITLLVSRIMIERRSDEIGEAIAALVAGDGSGHASGGAIAQTALSVYSGGTPTGTESMTYQAYLLWLFTFFPGRCTTILGYPTDIVQLMTMPKPSVDPIWLYSLLDKATLGAQPVLVNNRLSADVRFVIHEDVTTDTLIGIDKRYALIAYREAGTDLTETNKIINGQWDEIVLSNTVGFQTLFASARKLLDCDA